MSLAMTNDDVSTVKGGLTDVSLEVLRAFRGMRNIDGLRKALDTHREIIASEVRQEIVDEIRDLHQLVDEGTAIEAVEGSGYLLELDHPMIASWAKGGYFMTEKRVAAAKRRINGTGV